MKKCFLLFWAVLFAVASGASALESVKVGWVATLGYAPMLVAMEKGYYRNLGLEIKLEPLPGGGDVLVMTAAGHFDVGGAALGARAWNAFKAGMEFVLVAPFWLDAPPLSSPLLVRKELAEKGLVKSIKDLKGHKVAVNAVGVSTEYNLEKALNTEGMSIKDVEMVTIPFPLMPQALATGAIDAAVGSEPFVAMAVKKGYAVVLSDDYITYQPVVIFYNKEFATKRRKVAEGFMTGLLKGARDLYFQGWKTDEHARIIEKYTKIPAETVKEVNPPFVDPNGRFDLADLMLQQEFQMKRGYLKYTDKIEVNRMINSSFVEAALKALGEIKGVEIRRR